MAERIRNQWNMVCPDCKDDEGFTVKFVGSAKITCDGTEDVGDHEWDEDSALTCSCGWSGFVKDANSAYDDWREDHCDECDGDLTDGEGADGLCGSCADKSDMAADGSHCDHDPNEPLNLACFG